MSKALLCLLQCQAEASGSSTARCEIPDESIFIITIHKIVDAIQYLNITGCRVDINMKLCIG